MRMMRWFKKKSKTPGGGQNNGRTLPLGSPLNVSTVAKVADFPANFPSALLERIFVFVCPHTRDETYESCETSAPDDSCMLCDLRELAHCALVSKKWHTAATNLIYHSIRIDAVHYCPLEGILAEKRKRRSKFNRNGEPEDTPHARLKLLCRTVREHQEDYALKVQFLKLPYMTRAWAFADLARTLAVLPNLRYVDLPEGIFRDDASCNTLKQEIQARCSDLRKMSYKEGSEANLELLASGRIWSNLEVLELSNLEMDPTVLRQVLGSLPQLHALKIADMKTVDDQLFRHYDLLSPFPAVNELILENIPRVTAAGLIAHLARPEAQNALKTLSLTTTGVHPSTLQQVLETATQLEKLSIVEAVFTSFPTGNHIKPLYSLTLKVLHYEITLTSSVNSHTSTLASYYTYLTSSLIGNGLPNLRELFVRDADFPESLIDLAPPAPAFAFDPDRFSAPKSPGLSSNGFSSPAQNRFSSNNPFARSATGPGFKQELVVYSKDLDEMEWNFSRVEPPKGKGRRGSVTAARPVSSHGLEGMTTAWAARGGSRHSVIVGNGFGGFLAVPTDDNRPSSSAGEKGKKRGDQYDMWR